MAYLPSGLPAVRPTLDDRAFWEHCAKRILVFQRCAACGRFRHPPMPICPACHAETVEWVEASGPMRVFTYTWVHHPAHPAVKQSLPYNVTLVEFPACGGVRLVSNVIDAAPHDLTVGAELTLVWEEGPDRLMLPRFSLIR